MIAVGRDGDYKIKGEFQVDISDEKNYLWKTRESQSGWSQTEYLEGDGPKSLQTWRAGSPMPYS